MNYDWSNPLPEYCTGEKADRIWKEVVRKDRMVYYRHPYVYYKDKKIKPPTGIVIPADVLMKLKKVTYMDNDTIKMRASLLNLLVEVGVDTPREVWDYLIDNKGRVCSGEIDADDIKAVFAITTEEG